MPFLATLPVVWGSTIVPETPAGKTLFELSDGWNGRVVFFSMMVSMQKRTVLTSWLRKNWAPLKKEMKRLCTSSCVQCSNCSVTSHYTSWLIGILTMVCYSPQVFIYIYIGRIVPYIEPASRVLITAHVQIPSWKVSVSKSTTLTKIVDSQCDNRTLLHHIIYQSKGAPQGHPPQAIRP